ncbi:18351_t:CDS:2 [Entrophospora sp. SA101]|nr:3703_t:CDS:2 [Entrophospora sp. SA101]CAJ0646605.1 9548_t:CDS:2 [Entrophospora sp. SA101]CAJ0748093.1 9121_t:CDS:2 [Entrophospora sp. SA101]CAJ0751407.1 18786_t:CDS:2 [Entrophospora sp. SA101]CAJ0752249.1 23453_t:CDS:2 [Entrophospora sp. SA101]
MDPQNGISRSEPSVLPTTQLPESAASSHAYNSSSRKDRSISPRSGGGSGGKEGGGSGYRHSSYSPPRRRSQSPRGGGYRNGKDDRYRDDRYARDDKYDRSYGRSGYRDDRGYRDHPYPPERRGPPRRSKPIDRGSEKERRDSTTLYVGNLPYSFHEQDVADMFERYGRLRKFEDRRDAEDAFDKYNGTNVEGRRLKLDCKKDQRRKDKYGPGDRSSDPYGRGGGGGGSPVGMRGFSPNYRSGGRTPSPPYSHR